MYNEDTFVKENSQMNAYYRSKIQCELWIQKFNESDENKKDENFGVVTLCPGVITGKTFLPTVKGAILGVYHEFLRSGHLDAPQIYFPHVDVQDCAEAHVRALTKGKLRGRYGVGGETHKFVDFFNPAIKHFEKDGYKITTSELSACAVWTFSWINRDAKNVYWQWNIKAEMDSSAAEKDFGMKFGGKLEQSIIDTCQALVDHKLVELKK